MFNVPIPDGTTAHAVGAVLIAVLLGPWAAVIAVSIALLIQALFFGDGGVLAYGANVFNMAIVMPFVGYARLPAPRPARVADVAQRAASRPASAPTWASTSRRWPPPSSSASSPTSSTAVRRARPALRAVPPLARPIPAMALRPPHGRRHRRVRADRRGDRLPAAGQPADAADQPRRRARDRCRRPAATQARVALGASIGLATHGGPHAARARSPPAAAFGEDGPEDLDLQKYDLDAVPTGLRNYAGFWSHALFAGLRLQERRPSDGRLPRVRRDRDRHHRRRDHRPVRGRAARSAPTVPEDELEVAVAPSR